MGDVARIVRDSNHRLQGALRVLSYAARRLLLVLPLLVGVLTLVFLLVAAAPGEPFQLEPAAGASREAAARLREIYGAGRPLAQRYFEWLAAYLSFHLGRSISYREPVAL